MGKIAKWESNVMLWQKILSTIAREKEKKFVKKVEKKKVLFFEESMQIVIYKK